MKIYPSMLFFSSVFLFYLMSQTNFSVKAAGNVSLTKGYSRNLLITSPICFDRSDIPTDEMHWLYMPKSANELATNEYYGYLAGQLIRNGVVNASDCPLNGLWPSGYANSCGLEKSHEISVKLQNVYDDEILAAGKEIGVPPVMIKQLIRYESQFWPVQMGPYHFGLGHLTYIGARNALLWNQSLFEDTYVQLVTNQLSTTDRPSQLLSMLDASCPPCAEKINIQKAEQSITYITKVLYAYCRQTTQIVYNATEKDPGTVVDYATIWKLTLLNYNVGPLCVYNAVNASYQATKPDESDETDQLTDKLSWDVISSYVDQKSCSRGIGYVQNITRPFYDFKINP
jgi:hypothetical protein